MNTTCLDHSLLLAFWEIIINVMIPGKPNKDELNPYVDAQEAMEILRISSPTTLQKYRDEGLISYYPITRKHILYDRFSIHELIQKKRSL
jgi:hypothetical protein